MTMQRTLSGLGMVFVVLMGALALIGGNVSGARAASPEGANRVDVKVLDAKGSPIAQADVRFFYIKSGSTQGVTGSDGVARVALEEKDSKWLRIEVNAKGKASAKILWSADKPDEKCPDLFTFRLDDATTIGGRVVDEEGKPVVDATVVYRIGKKYPDSTQWFEVGLESATVDGNGKWSIAGVPEDFDAISLGVWSPKHLESTGLFSFEKFQDREGLKAKNAKLMVRKGVPVDIKVVGPGGAPISGATMVYGEYRAPGNAVPEIRLNDKGEMRLGIVRGTTAIVTVMAKGYAPQQKRVTVNKEAVEVEVEVKFELAPAEPLKGKVVDPEGKPIGGATVTIDLWGRIRPFDVQLTTDENGNFVWADAPADEVQAEVTKQGFAELRSAPLKAGKENVVRMQPPTRFSGKVVDKETGKLIENFTVVDGYLVMPDRPEFLTWNSRVAETGKNGVFERSFDQSEINVIVRVEAEGYYPADSDAISTDGKGHEYTYKLAKGENIEGVAVGPDGKPLSKARVLLMTPKAHLYISSDEIQDDLLERLPNVTTGADGKFKFSPQLEPYALLILSDNGYGQAFKEDFEKTKTLEMKPWARVEVETWTGTKATEGTEVILQLADNNREGDTNPLEQMIVQRREKSDKNGKIVFDRVMPVKMKASKMNPLPDGRLAYGNEQLIDPKPGETVRLKLGGKGRPVVGRAEIPEEVAKSGFDVGYCEMQEIVERPKMPPLPEGISPETPEGKEWYKKWYETDEGKAFLKEFEKVQQARSFQFELKKDGSFRVEDVEPGKYQISIQLHDLAEPGSTSGSGSLAAKGNHEVTVPEIPGGVSNEPMEIKPFKLTVWPHIKVGEAAPAFTIKTLDGKEIKLEDFKGKYVLLDFWATWCGPCRGETPHMKAVWEAYGKNPKFAMIGLSLDEETKPAEKYVKDESMGWTQGFLGPWGEPEKLTDAYGVDGIPSIWLIGPDGKVIAKELRGEEIIKAVKEALKP